jgi:hypothetical protein
VVTKNFIIAKNFCTYSMKMLRQDKTRRDHRDRSRALRMTRVIGAALAADEAYGKRRPHRAAPESARLLTIYFEFSPRPWWNT